MNSSPSGGGSRRRVIAFCLVAALACPALAVNGCGGGGGSSVRQPTALVTPTGSYALTVTPTATTSGSAKNLPLSPISLTLVVM